MLHPIDVGMLCSCFHLSRGIFFISALISSLTLWLFSSMFVCLFFHFSSCDWFLASYHYGQKRCLICFHFLKFTENCFVAYHVIYTGECSMCIWKEWVFYYLNGLFYMYLLSQSYVSFKAKFSLMIFCMYLGVPKLGTQIFISIISSC